MSRHLPLIVLGAGPAGIAAAVEARRSGVDVLLLDPLGEAGGGIRVAHEVRNIAFLPDRVSGPRVAAELASFAARWGLAVAPDQGARIHLDGSCAVVVTARGAVLRGLGVVVATGTRPLLPSIDGLPTRLEPPWAASAPDAWAGGPIRTAAMVGASDVAFDQGRWLRSRGVCVKILCRSEAPGRPLGWSRRPSQRASRCSPELGLRPANRFLEEPCCDST